MPRVTTTASARASSATSATRTAAEHERGPHQQPEQPAARSAPGCVAHRAGEQHQREEDHHDDRRAATAPRTGPRTGRPPVGSATTAITRRDERERREGPPHARAPGHDRAGVRRNAERRPPRAVQRPRRDARLRRTPPAGAGRRTPWRPPRRPRPGGRAPRTGNSGAHTAMMCQAGAPWGASRPAGTVPGRRGTARDADVLAAGTPTRTPWHDGPGPAGPRNQEVTMTTATPSERHRPPAVPGGPRRRRLRPHDAAQHRLPRRRDPLHRPRPARPGGADREHRERRGRGRRRPRPRPGHRRSPCPATPSAPRSARSCSVPSRS